MVDKKTCKQCLEQKLPSQFNGRMATCKTCQGINDRARYLADPDKFRKATTAYYERNKQQVIDAATRWRRANPEKTSAIHRLKRHGITQDQFIAMKESQGFGCKVCGRPESECTKGLCIDHDHKTGKIRGLLCNGCNAALGFMQDDIAAIRALVTYLEGV